MAGKSRMSVTRPSKMLRYARMAAMRKLRRGIGHIRQRRLWADSRQQMRIHRGEQTTLDR
jgi:hypothetical protein